MRKFDDERSALKHRLSEMGQLSEKMISLAIDALLNRDDKAIKAVRASEKIMDRFQLEIDDEAIRLITVYTPVAGDLRFLLMAGRIASDLERIGDQARNMCKYVKLLMDQADLKLPAELPKMADHVCGMLRSAIEAFDQGDPERAVETINMDTDVDDLDRKLFKGVMTQLEDAPELRNIVALVLLSRSLERIGDHVTNICEQVVYLVEAKDIRHVT